MGIGRNVGVDGLEMGVGIELVVLVVAIVLMLLLPSVDTESLESGLLFACAVCESTLGARLPFDGEGEAVAGDAAAIALNAEGAAVGLEIRRRSFSLSLSFAGDGESSIISTHPDVSLAGVRLFSLSESILCRRALKLLLLPLLLSGDEAFVGRRDDSDDPEVEGDEMPEGPALGVDSAFPLTRFVTLVIRSRGTRVPIFCSKTLTRALISETICTPRLLAVVPVTVLVDETVDAVRLVARRGIGVRGGMREGEEEKEGSVEERARAEGGGVEIPDFGGWKPAR